MPIEHGRPLADSVKLQGRHPWELRRSRTLAGGEGDGSAALGELGDLGGRRDVGEEDTLGEGVSSLESGSGNHLCGVGVWCLGLEVGREEVLWLLFLLEE